MDEVISAIKKAIGEGVEVDLDAIRSAVEEHVDGLKRKNDELIRDNKRLKRSLENGDSDKAKELERELDEAKDQLESVTAERDKLSKTYERETKKLASELDSERAAVSRLVVDNGLTEALTKANVAPQFIAAAKALLREKVSVVAEGDERKAVIDDKPLSDYIAEWSQGDEGKVFVRAAHNTGGGAVTGNGGEATTNKSWGEMSLKERTELWNQDPGRARQLKEAG